MATFDSSLWTIKGPIGGAALRASEKKAKEIEQRTATLEAVDGIAGALSTIAARMRTDAFVEEKKRLEGKSFCSTAWCRHVARIDELIDKLHALKAEALK